MTIIDCHTHIGRNTNINASIPELLKSMDKAHIDKAIVFANKIGDAPNEYLCQQIAPHRDRLYGVAAYSPDSFRYVDLEHLIKDNGLVGIKFYTGYEHYYPYDLYENKGDRTVSSLYHNPLQICSDLSIPAIFHCGDCHCSAHNQAKLKYAHPLGIDEVAVDYDDVKFIIAHAGNPWWLDAAQVCYKNKNVYADISGFIYGEFAPKDVISFNKMINGFLEISSIDKLLFGTDFPISNQKSYMETIQDNFGRKFLQTLSDNVLKVFNLL